MKEIEEVIENFKAKGTTATAAIALCGEEHQHFKKDKATTAAVIFSTGIA